ncbi:hypothetical protein L4174_010785 [Photobacterium sp. CCB-ST2H9]|uniref:SEL1-like repeat protein n=1 Tax=Photobacterium sp. CCB-ST2H9 TaxID=2912855 RepID=UPI0020034CAE|nr:hypothetical protein [Photobacterium sp. CCB-ST2H9]UTM56318.1 hypothetical protein L4174_010785 [Photobacterium sp. CCB-ST2H9]
MFPHHLSAICRCIALSLPLLAPVSASETMPQNDAQRWQAFAELYQNSPEDLIAQRKLLMSIEQHHHLSAAMLGRMLVNGEGGEANPAKGLSLFELSAQLGDAQSAYYAFLGHNNFWSEDSDPNLSAPYLWQAASQGVNDSQDYLVSGYLYGMYGLPHSPEAARSWAYASNSEISEAKMLEVCASFDPILLDQACIKPVMNSAEKTGDAFAHYRMGYVMQYGLERGQDADQGKAEAHFQAALAKYPLAVEALYSLYTNPEVHKLYDPQRALDLLNQAIQDENPYAMDLRGQWHLKFGEPEQAISSFTKAEQSGYCGETCLFQLATHQQGEQAVSNLQQAAVLGSSQAKYQLALKAWEEELPKTASDVYKYQRVQNGILMPKHLKYGYNDSAKQLWFDAAWPAEALTTEETVVRRHACPEPESDAFVQMHQAAVGGAVEATRFLERYYRQKKQTACANVWLRESAALGDPISQIRTGELYWRRGSTHDLKNYWYRKADENLVSGYGYAGSYVGLSEDRQGLMPGHANGNSNHLGGWRKDVVYRFDDGGISLPSRLVPPSVSAEKLRVNITQIWPTHCGYLAERATGELLFLGDVKKGLCYPALTDRQRMEQVGVESLVHNIGASAVLLRDGSVMAWGSEAASGVVIQSSLSMFSDSQYKTLEEELATHDVLKQGVVQLAATQGAFFALKEDGSVYTWGMYTGDWDNRITGKYQSISADPGIPILILLTDDGRVEFLDEHSAPSTRTQITINQAQIIVPKGAGAAWTVFAIDAEGHMQEFAMIKPDSSKERPLFKEKWKRFGQRYDKSKYYTVAETRDGKIFEFVEPINSRNQHHASDIYPHWRIRRLVSDTPYIEWF